MHFQKLQDRHKLCIFNITLLAYDYLFEQHRSSHDECLMNKSTSNQGAWHDHCPSSGAVKSRFEESLKRPTSLGQISIWITWGIGRSNEHLLVAWQHNNRGISLHSESVDIVEKVLHIIKDPLG